MLKYMVKQHDSQTVVKVKTSKSEELITREVNNLAQSPLRGLFSLKYRKGSLFYHYINRLSLKIDRHDQEQCFPQCRRTTF